jgi:DNA-binding MarR family transcriptional regulator
VLRQAQASDRRSYIVRLTPKGMSQFSAIAKAHEGWIDELLVDIDAAEAESLIEQLDGLVMRVRNGEARP